MVLKVTQDCFSCISTKCLSLYPGLCNTILLHSCRKWLQTPWDTIWPATRCHHESMSQVSGQPVASEDKALPRPWSSCNADHWVEWMSISMWKNPLQWVSDTWERKWALKRLCKIKVKNLPGPVTSAITHPVNPDSGTQINYVMGTNWKHYTGIFSLKSRQKGNRCGTIYCGGLQRPHIQMGMLSYRNKLVAGVSFLKQGREWENWVHS